MACYAQIKNLKLAIFPLEQKIDGFVLKNMSERALELLVPIIGDRIKVVAALKKLETCDSNADCVPTTDERCEVEVVQQMPKTPVVSAARYFFNIWCRIWKFQPEIGYL